MNIVIQIVIKVGGKSFSQVRLSMFGPGRCFSKVPSIRPDFPNWWYYRELRSSRERELSQTQRGCQKPQLFSWQPHLSSEFHRVEKYNKYKYNSERESLEILKEKLVFLTVIGRASRRSQRLRRQFP